MIRLRRLEYADAAGMLEWMNDDIIMQYFKFNGKNKTIDEIKIFIDHSYTEVNQHFAVADYETNEYLGTISLKNIDKGNKKAEYAICLRSKAIGKGIAKDATNQLIRYAQKSLNLHKIYLNVLAENIRASRFYEKMGFIAEGIAKDDIILNGDFKTLKLYSLILENGKRSIYSRVPVKRNIDEHGELVVFQSYDDFEFDIKRIFYIKNVKNGEVRGKHANKKSEFLMICLQGSVNIRVTDGKKEEIIHLDYNSDALYIPRQIWKDMYDFDNNCILMVLSNEYYDNSEYIRDFNEYKNLMGCV